MKKFVVFTLVIIFLIVGFIIMNNSNDIVEASSSESSTVKKSSNAGITPKKKETKDTKNEVTRIKVDIKGSVVSPDVYEVDSNSRVIDIINIAGGTTEDADTDNINLSKKVSDEDVIIIYSREELESNKKSYEEKIDYCTTDNNSACATNVVTFDDNSNSDDTGSTIININSATVEDFMKLSGIGEAKAKAIVEYRNSIGSFSKVEDIKNVTGIGDSIFDKIKDYITI